MDIKVIYRIFHPTATEYMFILATHSTFSEIKHILSHKVSLNKSRKWKQQKKPQKICKHMVTPQYTAE
jgi:hypothetical protein